MKCYDHLAHILHQYIFSLILGQYLGAELLGHKTAMFNFIKNCKTFYLSDCTSTMYESSGFSISSPKFGVLSIFDLVTLSVQLYYIVILFCISLMTDYTEHFLRLVYIFNANYKEHKIRIIISSL